METWPYLNVQRISFPCATCKQDSSHRVVELIGCDSVACIYCQSPIDLQSDEIQSAIKETADLEKRIWITEK